MRILGIGDTNDLGDMYIRLQRAGHDIRVCVRDEDARDTCEGLIPIVNDWKTSLGWVRQAGTEGLILFETAADGALQDELRRDGLQVIGGSALGDRLESDRAFGQKVMAEVGMQVAPVHAFTDFDQAAAFVRQRPLRYVYKVDGAGTASMRTYVGELEDGADVLGFMQLQRESWPPALPQHFNLMDRLMGVEVGVGAYFNGRRFLRPACLDWEHKRFFNGDLGELTGEMGTLVTYERSDFLFERTLGRMEAWLERAGYCGYININTIVNEEGVWPLEFTCRFGYPGYSILDPLQEGGWTRVLTQLLQGEDLRLATLPGYAVGVVLTVPPFPYRDRYAELSKGMPIQLLDMSEEEREGVHPGEVALRGGALVASGLIGYLMVVTGTGATAAQAQSRAYALARKVVVPNLRYRTDIASRFIRQDEALMSGWGYLPSQAVVRP